MNNLQDLNIKKEVLPLFNYSLNYYTEDKIINILETPLNSKNEIIKRQNILSGFASNYKILKDYSYTATYLREVYLFLNDEYIEDLSNRKFRYKILTSRQTKIRSTSKFNLLILFFFRLESNYFSRLDLSEFPKEYSLEIKGILQFLSYFKLSKYELLIRESRLKDKHIIELTEIINKLKKKELISIFWEDFFLFEAYLSINNGMLKNNFVFPEIKEKGIKLLDFYHPLIKEPVKNNFETFNNVIVLNGPNMSGKSTFLKSVGLCLYFGHLGIGIPAKCGEIPFCNHFSIDINRKDDINNGYSHFMTEIMSLKNTVEQALSGKHCFAIFDELFSGTNVEDAFEICKTTINGLSKYENCYFLISTHIQELKNVSNTKIANYYIDCKLIDDKPTFTYKLKKGWSDINVGRILFDKQGLNKLLK